jgi:hypothetical protein
MARYFFDVETATTNVLDDMGDELLNEQEAREDAVKARMRVRDERGEPLLQLTLSFALQRFK